MGELIPFPERVLEPLEPVSELGIANIAVFQKIMGGLAVENPNIVRGED
jgi:hypothetical protein